MNKITYKEKEYLINLIKKDLSENNKLPKKYTDKTIKNIQKIIKKIMGED